MEEKANEIGRDESKAGKSGLLNLVLDVNACIFLTSFLVYLVLLVMEKVREGSVSSFTDVDIVLYICLAAGFLHILAVCMARKRGVPRRQPFRPGPCRSAASGITGRAPDLSPHVFIRYLWRSHRRRRGDPDRYGCICGLLRPRW